MLLDILTLITEELEAAWRHPRNVKLDVEAI